MFKMQNLFVGEASTIATIKVGDGLAHPPSLHPQKDVKMFDKVLG